MNISKFIPKKIKKAIKHIFTINRDTRALYQFSDTCKKKEFENKIAIITGGAGGIGRAISVRLAVEGAKVYVCGRTESSLDDVVSEIRILGGVAEAIVLDVKNYSAVENIFKDIYDKEGHIDYLVCSAGGSARQNAKLFYEQDINVINEIILNNLIGTINCCRAVSPFLINRKNTGIVNISSIIGIGGKSKCSDYAAAKAGIIGFSRSIAIELSPLGVRVNVISPGKIQRGIMNDINIEKEISCNYVGYEGRPEDIASAVSFLLSDDAKFITGQNLIIDGGRTLGLHGD